MPSRVLSSACEVFLSIQHRQISHPGLGSFLGFIYRHGRELLDFYLGLLCWKELLAAALSAKWTKSACRVKSNRDNNCEM